MTQFETVTAAAYLLLAEAGVRRRRRRGRPRRAPRRDERVDSRVQALTNVGLEHTRWLGPTVADIAREKLAVVRPGGTLVVGAGLHPDAMAQARRVAGETGSRLVEAPADPGVRVAAAGAFQRRNFALAAVAAEAFLGRVDPAAIAAAAAAVEVPGRMQVVARAPLTILDGAHNPAGRRRWRSHCPRSSIEVGSRS